MLVEMGRGAKISLISVLSRPRVQSLFLTPGLKTTRPLKISSEGGTGGRCFEA